MIEIKVPKEVRKYKEKLIAGLTLRQLISVVVTSVIVIPIYAYIRKYIGDNITGYLIMVISAPLLLIGFYEKDGLSFEKYLVYFLEYHFLIPQKRKYIVENITIEENE